MVKVRMYRKRKNIISFVSCQPLKDFTDVTANFYDSLYVYDYEIYFSAVCYIFLHRVENYLHVILYTTMEILKVNGLVK